MTDEIPDRGIPHVQRQVAAAALRVVARLEQASTPIERIVALNSEGVIAGILATHADDPDLDLETVAREYVEELDHELRQTAANGGSLPPERSTDL